MELVYKSFVTMVIKPQLFVYLRLVLTILTNYYPLGEDSNAKFPTVLQHLPQVCQVGHTIDRRIISSVLDEHSLASHTIWCDVRSLGGRGVVSKPDLRKIGKDLLEKIRQMKEHKS